MIDTTNPADFASTLSEMVRAALQRTVDDRRRFEDIVASIDAGDIVGARRQAEAGARFDKRGPLVDDSIRCAVDAALPRGHADIEGGMG